MKGFKKLALTAAIAALPAAGFAMQPLAEEEMGDVTGQDGININLNLTNLSLDVLIDDTDGLTGVANAPAGFGTRSGGILITDLTVNGEIDIDIDAGGAAGTPEEGVLVVNIGLANNFAVQTGDISAVDTNDANDGTYTASANTILESTSLTFNNGLDLQLQLGSGAEQLIRLEGDAGDLTFGTLNDGSDNFQLNDVAGGGALIVDEMTISVGDLSGLTISMVEDAGMVINTNAALAGLDIDQKGVNLGGGTTQAIGDVYIRNLDMSGQTITISGK